MKKLFFVGLFLVSALVRGQEPEMRLISAATSPAGNYLYLAPMADSALLAGTAYFRIEKTLYDPADTAGTHVRFVKAGVARVAGSVDELRSLFSSTDLADLRKGLNLSSDRELLRYFQTHKKAEQYSLFYLRIETRIALGQVFLDKDVRAGEPLVYKVTRVDRFDIEHPWGYAVVQSKFGDYLLPYLKPVLTGRQFSDSAAVLVWKLHIDQEGVAAIPLPKTKFPLDKNGMAVRLPFPLRSLRGRVSLLVDGRWVQSASLLPRINATGDTLTYSWYKKCARGENITAFLQAEDEVYNLGEPSDTAYAFAIGENSIPLVKAIRTSEVLGGVRITWRPLPARPYLTGIRITRFDSQDKLDSVAVLSPLDTVYVDRTLVVGEHYRYQVRALFLPGLGVFQKVPAEGVGTLTKFARPLPPYDLTAANENGHVRLKWAAADDAGFFGFFVYRGTSPKNIRLVAGPVRVRTWLDTSLALTGRSQYYYRVVSQNLLQDTSIYSNMAVITPVRRIELAPPSGIQFYYANGFLHVSWNNEGARDNAIAGYTVQRRRLEDPVYRAVAVGTAAFVDSGVLAGVTYVYRVAARTFSGDSSVYSEDAEFTLPKPKVDQVELFFVRNITPGVEVSLPQQVVTGRKAYNIYRRDARASTFTKLGSIDAGTFTYVDDSATPGDIYVYAITVTEKDGREGEPGRSLSIRRDGGAVK